MRGLRRHAAPWRRLGIYTRIRELPEEHELRRWCEVNQEYRASAEAGGAAERQKLAAQDGKCALCGCELTAGTCELDHVVPVRQALARSVQFCRRCGDCHSEKTLRESAQPTSFEEPHGLRRHGVRPEPQGASSGF